MSEANAFVGVAYHWAGGLAAASFYIPYTRVKRWSWESYWLVGGFFSWIIAPSLLAWILVPDVYAILREAPGDRVLYAFLFGMVWGVGGLTFGLTMRYLGIALGYAVALGMCAMFGTLVPPLFHGQLGAMFADHSGRVTLSGVGVCLVGIVFSGMAGTSKERELTSEQKSQSVSEFRFFKGMLVALFAGVLSAAMAFALDAAAPISEIAKRHLLADGRSDIWQGLPGLICVLLGGFVTNFVWCMILNVRNRTMRQYVALRTRELAEIAAAEGVEPFDPESISAVTYAREPETTVRFAQLASPTEVPLLANYALCIVAGFTWYFQFFFYTMGSTKMGQFGFSSWTLHMASIIIFSTLWGIAFKEWKGTSRRTHILIALGLFVLIASTVVVGYGNYLKARS
jgi:L-rhamnose-H+ transport protein